jgi:hypothetical protein
MAPQLQPPDFNRILKNELEENTERFRALEEKCAKIKSKKGECAPIPVPLDWDN